MCVCVSGETGLLGCVSNEMDCAVCAHEFVTRSGGCVVCAAASHSLPLLSDDSLTSCAVTCSHRLALFSSFCCRAFVCLFFALTSGNQRVSEMRGNQTQIVIQHENKRDIHCSHSSHLPVSQIIISECSTLINAAPCLHWWGLWLMRMIQYIYTTDLEVSSMYSIWYFVFYYMWFSVDLVCQTCCMPVDDCLSVYVLHALSCLCCCQYGWTSSLYYCSFIQGWPF